MGYLLPFCMPSVLFVRLTHTGLLPDGRPNTSSVFIDDADFGFVQQNRKVPVYVPVGGSVLIPLTSRSLFSLEQGAIAGYRDAGVISAEILFEVKEGQPTTYNLAAINPNIDRNAGLLRVVIDNTSLPGITLDALVNLDGLGGAFTGLDGDYSVVGLIKNQNLTGPSVTESILTFSSPGANIAGAQLAGVDLTLVEGKTVAAISSENQAGGFPNTSAYFSDDVIVHGNVDPKSIVFTAIQPASAPDNSLFLSSTSEALTWKDKNGVPAPVGGGGGGFDVVAVPWTTISNAGSTYYVELGAPVDLYGTSAANWVVTPGTPGSSSAVLSSATQTAAFWIGQGCFQCGPEPSPKRAFLSAFNPGAVGITGCATGLEGNNDRSEATVFYGNLHPASGGLYFQVSWNGVTPLTVNSGQVLLFVA